MAEKPSKPDNKKSNTWLQRIFAQWKPRARGDHIAAQVGEGAKNVVVGKNIIQIGTLRVPIWFAMLLIVCLLMITGAITYPTVEPWFPRLRQFAQEGPNETLIVIATFHSTNSTNTEPHKKIWYEISEQVATLGKGMTIRPAVESTMLTADQRSEAEALGRRYNASMVIWGEETGVEVRVNVLNLKPMPFGTPETEIIEKEAVQLAMNRDAYIFFINTQLPSEVSFLALFAVAQSELQAPDSETQYAALETLESALTAVTNTSQRIVTAKANAYFLKGWIHQFYYLQYEEAIAAYTQAITFDPDQANAYFNRADAYYSIGCTNNEDPICDLTLQGYTKFIVLRPNDPWGYYERGDVYWVLGESEKAISDFEQYLILRPEAEDRAMVKEWIAEIKSFLPNQ